MRNATGKFDHFKAAGDFAFGVGKGLAVLAGNALRETFMVLLDQLFKAEHHSGSA